MLFNLIAKSRHNQTSVEPGGRRECYLAAFLRVTRENTRHRLRPLVVERLVVKARLVRPLAEVKVLLLPRRSILLKGPNRRPRQKGNAAKTRTIAQDAVVSQIFSESLRLDDTQRRTNF